MLATFWILDEMVGWDHQCIEHELGQTPGDGEGLWSLVCCSPWGGKESDMTWWLNNNEIYFLFKKSIKTINYLTIFDLEQENEFSIWLCD